MISLPITLVLSELVLVLLDMSCCSGQRNAGYEIVGAQTRVYYVDSESGHNSNNGLAPNLAFATIKRNMKAHVHKLQLLDSTTLLQLVLLPLLLLVMV